jgi:translation initiation factor IF-3
MKNNRFKREQPLQVICNEKINYDTVRVNDIDGESRIIDTKTAIRLAKSKELDLILIAENANPPVCKVTSLNKFLYEKKQKEKEQKKKQRENFIETKEIRMSLNIDSHDLETKTRNARKFLDKGASVQITVTLKGRERGRGDAARQLLAKFAEMCEATLNTVNFAGNRISAKIK